MQGARAVAWLAAALLLAAGSASAAAGAAPAGLRHFLDQAAAIEPWLVGTRRLLHTYPELFYQEHNTSSTLRRLLDEMGVTYQ